MILKNTLLISILFLSTHSFAARLITCDDEEGNSLTFSTSSFSGTPMLSVTTADQSLGFHGNHQISILQYHAGSYTVDAADRKHGIQYDNVQFEVLEQDQFDTILSISKVEGCTRETTQFEMHCTSEDVVF
jgi:hypothetical protein